jgi:hypothetical protein
MKPEWWNQQDQPKTEEQERQQRRGEALESQYAAEHRAIQAHTRGQLQRGLVMVTIGVLSVIVVAFIRPRGLLAVAPFVGMLVGLYGIRPLIRGLFNSIGR